MRTQNGVIVGYLLGVLIAGFIGFTASVVFAEPFSSNDLSEQQSVH